MLLLFFCCHCKTFALLSRGVDMGNAVWEATNYIFSHMLWLLIDEEGIMVLKIIWLLMAIVTIVGIIKIGASNDKS